MNMLKTVANTASTLVCALGIAAIMTGTASAHCDTMDGPTIKDAQAALEKGDVTSALKWVAADDEAQIKDLFAKTLAVRAKGDDARELADQYFFETLVRLHRAGEGYPFTGVKPAGTPVPPPIARADAALESGNIDDLAKKIGSNVEAEIRKRFAAAAEAQKHKDESVEDGRKFVLAYVKYTHFIEAIHEMVMGHGAHDAHAGAVSDDGHAAAAKSCPEGANCQKNAEAGHKAEHKAADKAHAAH